MGGREPVLQAPGAELGVSRGGLLGTAAAVWSAFGPREVAKPSKPARTSASQKPFCDKGYRSFTKPSKKPCTGFLNRVSEVRFDHVGRVYRQTKSGCFVCIWFASGEE